MRYKSCQALTPSKYRVKLKNTSKTYDGDVYEGENYDDFLTPMIRDPLCDT